eukprot:m.3044 g.3044  ORF g.3044 m.3044 type:complete len:98 (-) comp2257_c0_seq1:162-455(-)
MSALTIRFFIFADMLIGIGLSCTVRCLQKNPYHINAGEGKTQLVVSGAFLLLSQVSSLIVVPLNKFRLNRTYGIYLCSLYAVFVILSVVLEFVHVKI